MRRRARSLPVSRLTILRVVHRAVSAVQRVPRETGIVTRSHCLSSMRSGQLGVPCAVRTLLRAEHASTGPALALPERRLARPAGVVVAGAGAELLLLAVVLGEQELHNGCDEEEEDVQDSHGEDCGLQLAGPVQVRHVDTAAGSRSPSVALSISQRCSDEAAARAGAVAGEVRNGHVATDKADVDDDGDEGKEGNPAQEKGEEDAEEAVEDGGA